MGFLLSRLFPAADDDEQVEDGEGAGLDQSHPDLFQKIVFMKYTSLAKTLWGQVVLADHCLLLTDTSLV